MELNVVDSRLETPFHEQIGISLNRANELSDALDVIANKYKGKTVQTITMFSDILKLCNNTEEVVYCTINHCNWMAVTYGIIYCPPQNKKKNAD